MDFEDQLKQAIERGTQQNATRKADEKRKSLTDEQLRNRHNDFRLELSEYIETGMKKLAEHFPGFDYETIYGSRGWGGALSRDDLSRSPTGGVGKFFSRIELTVRPQNEYNVVNIAGKGMIKNKEIFTWNHFKEISDSKMDDFREKIDSWLLQYAEQFAAQ